MGQAERRSQMLRRRSSASITIEPMISARQSAVAPALSSVHKRPVSHQFGIETSAFAALVKTSHASAKDLARKKTHATQTRTNVRAMPKARHTADGWTGFA